jgi:hypothetical protein
LQVLNCFAVTLDWMARKVLLREKSESLFIDCHFIIKLFHALFIVIAFMYSWINIFIVIAGVWSRRFGNWWK